LVGWIFPYLTAVFAGILLLAITIYDKGFYAKVLSARPLLFLSRLSLPLYLIHFFFVPVFQKLPSVFLAFLCDLAVAIILSWPLDLLLTKAINAIFGKKKAKASIPEAT
jgi:peptidoglycan/LPS O-acetylase OafA/YrhL